MTVFFGKNTECARARERIGATGVFRGATECGSGPTKGSEPPFATEGLPFSTEGKVGVDFLPSLGRGRRWGFYFHSNPPSSVIPAASTCICVVRLLLNKVTRAWPSASNFRLGFQ